MILLQIALLLTIFSIINCFQFAAGILAKQIGLSFTRWFWISLFLPVISIIILLFLWDTKETDHAGKSSATTH
jgi:uncharacterized membrane protein